MDELDRLATAHNMCAGKQRHPSRAAARIEVAEKDAATGRRHHAYGCGLCDGIHVKVAPRSKTKYEKRRAARGRRYAAMGA